MTPPQQEMPPPFQNRSSSVKKTQKKNTVWFHNISQIFSKNEEVQTESSSKVVFNKRLCECEKDQIYKFSCKNGVQWFAETIIKNKIRRRANENVQDVILDEY